MWSPLAWTREYVLAIVAALSIASAQTGGGERSRDHWMWAYREFAWCAGCQVLWRARTTAVQVQKNGDKLLFQHGRGGRNGARGLAEGEEGGEGVGEGGWR